MLPPAQTYGHLIGPGEVAYKGKPRRRGLFSFRLLEEQHEKRSSEFSIGVGVGVGVTMAAAVNKRERR